MGRELVRRIRLGTAVLVAAGVAVAVAPGSAAVLTSSGVDWDTYGFANDRPGMNPFETTINASNVHRLRQVWSFKLGSVLDTQPLLAGQVLVPVRTATGLVSVPTDLVIAGSENGRLAAVNAATGAKVWEDKLGSVSVPACGDLPHFGITDTPAIDRTTNTVYVTDGKGRLNQLDLSTGRLQRRWTLTRDPVHLHDWSATTVLGSTVYTMFAGNCDIQPYKGQVIAVDTRRGSIHRWFVAGGSQGGGVWSWGGVSIDQKRRALYAATGNSFTPNDHVGYSEHVVRLTLGLHVKSSNYPGLPSPGDADFGATPLLYQAPGCPPQLAVGNKYGHYYVYDRNRIGRGAVQTISLGGSGRGQNGLLGIGAYDPSLRLVYVANPGRSGAYGAGMLAFRVASNCRLSLAWQAGGPATLTSGPTVAGGVVFYGTGTDGHLLAFNAQTGARLWSSDGNEISGAVFNAPSVVNGTVYADSWDGRLHAFRLK